MLSRVKSSTEGCGCAPLTNSIRTLLAVLCGSVCTRVIRRAESPLNSASSHQVSSASCGRTTESVPPVRSSSDAFARSEGHDSESSWRAQVRALSGHLRLLLKNGGLLTMASNNGELLYVSASQLIISIRLLHGESATFSVACAAAPLSISTPTIVALLRCAHIIAIRPLPVPISRMRLQCDMLAQLPSRQPSVPTFIAQRSCLIINCLNWNISLLI